MALVGIMPTLIVVVLASTADPNYGWLLFVTMPIAVLLGAIALVLGVIGIVIARIDRGGYAWPIVGTVLGAAQLFPAIALLAGG